MTKLSERDQRLKTAVEAIWLECGEVPPSGAEMTNAMQMFAGALNAGRKIPRVVDKTFQPLVGPRRDLEPE